MSRAASTPMRDWSVVDGGDERVGDGASSRSSRQVLATAVLMAVLVTGAVVAMNLGQRTGATSAEDLPDPSLGHEDAPVELIEYSDFGCPYCGRHARTVKPEIVDTYVETGLVRYAWRDLPYQGEASHHAAIAARAAQAQGAFWEFHDAVFETQDAGLDQDRLRGIANDLGLDLARYDEHIESRAHEHLIEEGLAEGRQLNLSGTPSFSVNGRLIVGGQPFEVFADVIEDAAAEAGSGAEQR